MAMFFSLFIILVSSSFLFDILLKILNYRYAKLHMYDSSSTEYINPSKETINRSTNYNCEKILNKIILGIIEFSILMILIVAGFKELETFTVDFFDRYILSGLLFFLFLWILFEFVNLLFAIHETFNTEKKYGFSKITPGLFLMDFIKRTLLTMIFGFFLFMVLIWVINSYKNWWLIIIAGSIALIIFINWIFPVLIMPIFYKLSSISETNIGKKIEEIAEQVGFKVNGIYVINYSERSSHSNALIAGFGKSKRIILFDTLLNNFEDDEILSIFAHETGHYVNRDIIKNMLIEFVVLALSVILVWYLVSSGIVRESFKVSQPYTELLYAVIFNGSLLYFTKGIISSYSRKCEYKADKHAAELMNSVVPMKRALKKLYKINLSNLNPHPLYLKFHYSHPAPIERLKYLNNLKISKGGQQ
ncbi:MAG: M48 family metallopeptidase [Kosmotoga sp.]|nr:MAG: M48 family metallopeptidase [Kosmotoga sp.]